MKSYLYTVSISLFGFLALFQSMHHEFGEKVVMNRDEKVSVKIEPDIEISLIHNREVLSWGQQIRYQIKVVDETDGYSEYDEINPSEVFLEVNFIPDNTNNNKSGLYNDINNKKNIEGLTLLGQSSCFGCHADKSNMIGPSFADISDKYRDSKEARDSIVHSIVNGSTGKWGQSIMPTNLDISEENALKMAEYILVQGSQKYSWVYPGLEGVLRVIEQPKAVDSGSYLLTASYTSTNGERGTGTLLLDVE